MFYPQSKCQHCLLDVSQGKSFYTGEVCVVQLPQERIIPLIFADKIIFIIASENCSTQPFDKHNQKLSPMIFIIIIMEIMYILIFAWCNLRCHFNLVHIERLYVKSRKLCKHWLDCMVVSWRKGTISCWMLYSKWPAGLSVKNSLVLFFS